MPFDWTSANTFGSPQSTSPQIMYLTWSFSGQSLVAKATGAFEGLVQPNLLLFQATSTQHLWGIVLELPHRFSALPYLCFTKKYVLFVPCGLEDATPVLVWFCLSFFFAMCSLEICWTFEEREHITAKCNNWRIVAVATQPRKLHTLLLLHDKMSLLLDLSSFTSKLQHCLPFDHILHE